MSNPHDAQANPDRANHIAILLVHGIGDFRAGSVTRAAADGLRSTFPELRFETEELLTLPQNTCNAVLHRTRLNRGSTLVDLLEFYWADVAGKIRIRRPFEAAARLLGVIREFPSMAVDDRSPKGLRWIASAIGVSFVIFLSIWVLALAGSLIELSIFWERWIDVTDTEVALHFIPGSIMFSPTLDSAFLDRRLFWSYAAQIIAMVMMSLASFILMVFVLVALLALVLRRLRPLGILLRTSAASGVLTYLLLFTATIFYTGSTVFIANVVGSDTFLAPLIVAGVFSAILGLLLIASIWIANLLRDVVHYLGTTSRGRSLPHQEATRQALAGVLDELRSSTSVSHVIIVCHSLGTVLVTDLLRSARRAGPNARIKSLDLVTAGSPIRRLICRLLPHRMPRPIELRRELADGSPAVARWFNVYRPLDFVGMRLVSVADGNDPEHGIQECPLLPRWRWPWGHANYWGDRRFTKLMSERVMAPIFAAHAGGASQIE